MTWFLISQCTKCLTALESLNLPASAQAHAHILLTAEPIREMEDYGLNEAISYANLMIIFYV